MSTFKEHEHPRHGDGKFAEKPGVSSGVALGEPQPPGEVSDVFRTRYDTLQEKITALTGEIDTAIDDLADDEAWQRLLTTMTEFPRYSFNNQLLIRLQRPEATRVAGFKKWKTVDRHVKKGEKGIVILAPATRRRPVTDTDGKPLLNEAGKPVYQTYIGGFTTVTVFDVSQTEGAPISNPMSDFSETPPDGFEDDMIAAAGELGYTVSFEEIPSSADGYTTVDGSKRIVVDSRLSPARRASVLAHEFGHAALGHPERFEDYHTGEGGHRGQMETEAESFSYVLARLNGMKLTPADGVSGGHAAYIGGWAYSDGAPDRKVIREAAETVSKKIRDVVTSGSWRNIPADML